MAAETTSETSFTIYQSTRCHIADDLHLQEANGSRVFLGGGNYFDTREGERRRRRRRRRKRENGGTEQ
jgi:hypothetical protein